MAEHCGTATNAISLVERIQNGDRSAEEQLVTQFGPRVYAMVMARSRRSMDAEDLTQDTLLAVIQALRLGKLNDAKSLPAYILGTARNIVSNYLRRTIPQQVQSDELEAPRQTWPDWQSAHMENRRLVREALDKMSQSDRHILQLALVRGLKPGEIATQLGLSPEVVRQRKSRAIRRVKDQIELLSRSPSRHHNDGRTEK